MKKSIYILMIIGFFTACIDSDYKVDSCPKSYFTEKFPKRPIDLSKRLGDSVLIEIAIPGEITVDTLDGKAVFNQQYQIDTVNLRIEYNRNSKNTLLIDSKENDTIFYGYVSKYKELYYLTVQKTDSTYWVGALNIDFDSIQGLGTIREQMCDLENFVEQNLQSNIIQKADTTTGIFEFYADKKLIRKTYSNLIAKYPKLKIISDQFDYNNETWQKIEDELPKDNKFIQARDEIVESVFPNPAVDFIQIDFNKNDTYLIQIIDNSGKVVLTKKFKDIYHVIPISELQTGFYILRVHSPNNNLMETHRIIIK